MFSQRTCLVFQPPPRGCMGTKMKPAETFLKQIIHSRFQKRPTKTSAKGHYEELQCPSQTWSNEMVIIWIIRKGIKGKNLQRGGLLVCQVQKAPGDEEEFLQLSARLRAGWAKGADFPTSSEHIALLQLREFGCGID